MRLITVIASLRNLADREGATEVALYNRQYCSSSYTATKRTKYYRFSYSSDQKRLSLSDIPCPRSYRRISTFSSSFPIAHWSARFASSSPSSTSPVTHTSPRDSALPPTSSAEAYALAPCRSFAGAVGRVQKTESSGGRPVARGSDRTFRSPNA